MRIIPISGHQRKIEWKATYGRVNYWVLIMSYWEVKKGKFPVDKWRFDKIDPH